MLGMDRFQLPDFFAQMLTYSKGLFQLGSKILIVPHEIACRVVITDVQG
jgi:hypothetical protein